MRYLVLLTALLGCTVQAAEPLTIDVYRDPNCGCCTKWLEHLRQNGFDVRDHEETDMSAVKSRLGVPPRLASCHTGVIDGQFVEGHVPANDILKMRRRPDLLGVATPGMPVGSPGMEVGDRKDAYDVIGLTRTGQEGVITHHPGH
ncbi:hypothetical protein IQ22_00273 [Pseudomonas duriflava]|uniref:Metal-binding protein n=1 Tax=Pseudomonas duriflava TaxID=459528 RepID=A0A562QPB2_9PSED|nr:DUF411 domain-containing protein [Pseudomonas duriflava]TWI58567.1 hypothetical protein IQ22_00273 [Pseudomonas duriflava]